MLAVLALLTIIILSGTIKIGVILGTLRQGLIGNTSILPAAITAVLVLMLSALAMEPVAVRSLKAMQAAASTDKENPPPSGQIPPQLLNDLHSPFGMPVLAAGVEPFRQFLLAHSSPAERKSVFATALRLRRAAERPSLTENDFATLGVAFTLTELKIAMQVSLLLLLPFYLLDLLVAALLRGLRWGSISPSVAALPFKLLLFILCDGWNLLARILVLSYA